MADDLSTHPLTPPPPGWRPGDRREPRDQMVRVDQAGEFGATRIYAGQLAILGDRHPMSRLVSHMGEQEDRHRALFDRMIVDRGIRPTALTPFWNVAGYALGAATALISPEAAMACTAAVETEIDKHYEDQIGDIGPDDPELSAVVAEFQAEEVEHREIALREGAARAVAYPVLFTLIRLGCKLAIATSKRI